MVAEPEFSLFCSTVQRAYTLKSRDTAVATNASRAQSVTVNILGGCFEKPWYCWGWIHWRKLSKGQHETELFDALYDTSCRPGRKKGDRLHDYAHRVKKQRTRAGQARSTVARPSTGVSSVTPSEPGHSSSHCHHDTGR